MFIFTTLVSTCWFAGCEKAKEMADNAVNKVKKDFKSAKDKIEKASQPSSTKKDKPNLPYSRPKSDSNDTGKAGDGSITYESFRRIATNRIKDADLEALARNPTNAASVSELNLYNAQISSKGLEILQKFPKLEKLSLQQLRSLKGNMNWIGKIKSLKSLDLTANPLNDADFGEISGLTKLEEIILTGTQITDEGFRCFKQMPKLAVMVMDRMGHLEGKGFKYVNRNSLKVVKANGSKIGYFALQNIGGSESLEQLWLNGARVTDKAMQGIGRCPNLKDVRLEKNDLTNKGVSFLRNHKKLESIVLAGNRRITNESLKYLTSVKSLKMVNVVGTSCSSNVKEEFLQYVPGCKLAF